MPDMVDRPDIVRDNPNVSKHHSNFQLKEARLTTELFGFIKPHMVIDDVATDDFDYRPDYRTRSYTLKAPLMQDVHRKLSYVKVDLSAILPLNFEKFYTNPVNGDDVPSDVSPVVSDGLKRISNAVGAQLNTAFQSINGSENFTAVNLTLLLKSLIFAEMFYSRGCLLSSLGCRLSKQFYCIIPGSNIKISTFDQLFDEVCSRIQSIFQGSSVSTITVSLGGSSKYVKVSNVSQTYAPDVISFRDFLNEIRLEGSWSITAFGGPTPVTISTDFNLSPQIGFSVPNDAPFNFGRVCAYQLACAEYFTNDHIDNIYSSELFRQYIGALIIGYVSNPYTFSYNGVSYFYDWLSGIYLTTFLNSLSSGQSSFLNSFYPYFVALFSYRRSLRYKDYFVSSRSQPLAVGDVNVSVDNNAVSVIDISRNIQVQRFLNAVNHAGRRLSNYIKTLFGNNIAPDRHVPHWLADLDEMVYTSEVENTADAQQSEANSVTAVFTGNSSNKELHFYADLPGYIIGLTSYDIERAYSDTIDRSFFIENRFDMFLPELQFVGDQPVYVHELDSSDVRPFGTAFGYQYRDMQYKLFYSVADGGFVDNLPGYGFLYRPDLFGNVNISPDFIRSRPSELDDFYLSLTGYSLGSYFHFISIITNNFSARRPMIANPKILE